MVRHGTIHPTFPIDVSSTLEFSWFEVGSVEYDGVLDPGTGKADGVVDDFLEVQDFGSLDPAVHSNNNLNKGLDNVNNDDKILGYEVKG